MPVRARIPAVSMLAAAVLFLGLFTAPLPALAQNVPANTPAAGEHLADLERQWNAIRDESRALGGSPSPSTSINNTKTRINELDDQIDRMMRVMQQLGASAADLDAMRRGIDEQSVVTLGDVPQEAAEQGAEKVLSAVCREGVGKVIWWAFLVGDIVEYGGKKIYKEISESRIKELVRQERIKIGDVYDLLSVLFCDRADEQTKLDRLEELRPREQALFQEIAKERARLDLRQGRATRRAVTQRDTDPAGDAEERRLYNEAGVRPVDPTQKRPAPFGVRGAGPVSSNIPGAPAEFSNVSASNWDIQLMGGFSFVSVNDNFGSGTVVRDREVFGALTPSLITRFGFDFDAAVPLSGGAFVGDQGKLIGSASYAAGSASDYGTAAVGEDGVSKIGLTYLYLLPGTPPSTGVGTDFAGDYIESSASVDNTWSRFSLGYAETIQPSAPGLPNWQIGMEALVERFSQEYYGLSEIYRPGSPDILLAWQETTGSSRNTWVGARISAGLTYPVTDRLSVGLSASLTPAYRTARAELYQYTSLGGIEQTLEEEFSGFVVGGSAGASIAYALTEGLSLELSYEKSCLPGVAGLHVPANPDEQPAHFESDTVKRDFYRANLNFRF
jgi:hypothetical protein